MLLESRLGTLKPIGPVGYHIDECDLKSMEEIRIQYDKPGSDDQKIYVFNEKNASLIIGEGGFGRVVWGVRELNSKREWVAVKIDRLPQATLDEGFTPEQVDARRVQINEMRLPNYDVYASGLLQSTGQAVIVSEVLAEPLFKTPVDNISDVSFRVSEAKTLQRLNWCIGLIRELMALHGKDIVHRDLTGMNVLYNPKKNKYQLIDFGGSRSLDEKHDQKTSTPCLMKTQRRFVPSTQKKMRNPDFQGANGYFVDDQTNPEHWDKNYDLKRLLPILAVLLGMSPKEVYQFNDQANNIESRRHRRRNSQPIYVQDSTLNFEVIRLGMNENFKNIPILRGIDFDRMAVNFFNKAKEDSDYDLQSVLHFFSYLVQVKQHQESIDVLTHHQLLDVAANMMLLSGSVILQQDSSSKQLIKQYLEGKNICWGREVVEHLYPWFYCPRLFAIVLFLIIIFSAVVFFLRDKNVFSPSASLMIMPIIVIMGVHHFLSKNIESWTNEGSLHPKASSQVPESSQRIQDDKVNSFTFSRLSARKRKASNNQLIQWPQDAKGVTTASPRLSARPPVEDGSKSACAPHSGSDGVERRLDFFAGDESFADSNSQINQNPPDPENNSGLCFWLFKCYQCVVEFFCGLFSSDGEQGTLSLVTGLYYR